MAAGIYGLLHTSLDAIPDLSDVQVIIYTDLEGRSPDLVEDQITYPISVRFISASESVKGVAEVASVGGFVKQYQVDLNPNALIAYNLSVKDITSAIQASNNEVGGKTSEVATTEYFVRGHGYIRGPADIKDIVLKVQNGTPVYVKNIARVHLGGDLRRGIAELDGKGEVVSGIVVMRYGENALNVIAGVKKKLQELRSSLPDGVQIIPTYDRSGIIQRAIGTLREKLIPPFRTPAAHSPNEQRADIFWILLSIATPLPGTGCELTISMT